VNIIECLDTRSGPTGDRPALVEGIGTRRRQLSYAELGARVDGVVAALRQAGLNPGARVLLAVPFSADMTVVLLGILKSGMVAMFIDPGQGVAEVASCLRAQPPDAIVAGRAAAAGRWLMRELRQIPAWLSLRGPGGLIANGPVEPQSAERRSSEDSALLTFTSGSTGQPKPVVRTHGFLRRQLAMIDAIAGVDDADVDLVAMPMFVLFNLARHITSVLPASDVRRPGRADPELTWLQLQRERATRIVASPALLERLARYCLRRGKRLPHLRRISTGGGPVPPTLPERLTAIAPAATVISVYGSTEAEPIASIDSTQVSISDSARMREGAGLLAGRAVTGCQVRVLRELPERITRHYSTAELDGLSEPPGRVGEIVVSGPHVLTGYADPARNAETKIDVDGVRWHRTGDAGYFDEQGRLWLAGRWRAAIRDNRGEIYPFQVEYAAESVPGVRRAALVASGGRRVLAVESASRSIDCARIARCVNRQAIDRVVVLRRIPVDRRHNAKVDYAALGRLVERNPGGLRFAMAGAFASLYAAAARLVRRIRTRVLTLRAWQGVEDGPC